LKGGRGINWAEMMKKMRMGSAGSEVKGKDRGADGLPRWVGGDRERLGRRRFLGTTTGALLAAVAAPAMKGAEEEPSLGGEIGLTTGSLNRQRERGILTVMALPKFMRDDLGMRLIDLNTHWVDSYEAGYLEEVRGAAAEAGCFITNLKVNHRYEALDAADDEERAKAAAHSRELVRVARSLGARWIRFPVPQAVSTEEGVARTVFRELATYAKDRGVRLVVENNGWMRSEADSVVRTVHAIGRDLAASAPDTGNWDDEVREAGLVKSFPGAVTCDFKVRELDAEGQHARYDLRSCFDIGWRAGFRGPWAIEHWHEDLTAFAREIRLIRDRLRGWMKEG
jgi:hypothetical protein